MEQSMNHMRSSILPPKLSALNLRDELEAMVLKELLGPGSPEEEIIESPGTRYFVGVLAPRKRARAGAEPSTDCRSATAAPRRRRRRIRRNSGRRRTGPRRQGYDPGRHNRSSPGAGQSPDSVVIRHDILAQPGSQGIGIVSGLGSIRQGCQPIPGQRKNRQSTSSVETPSTRRQASAETERRPHSADCGRSQLPRSGLQGLVRKRKDHWCVTLFLVNEQQEPERLKDTTWVFQPELMAEGVDGAAVIHKRHTILEFSGTDPAVKAENDLLAMLYRRHVEFAVGHGIGVHVDVSPDPNHAVRVCTRVVPSYEIPRTTPPRPEDAEVNPSFAKLEGLVLDMKLLAEANPKQYRPKFKPLVDAYKDWIDREEKRIADPAEGLATFKHVAQQAIARCRNTLKRIEAGLDLLDSDPMAAQAFQFMNRAMWLQRTHSIFAERVPRGDEKPDMGPSTSPRIARGIRSSLPSSC